MGSVWKMEADIQPKHNHGPWMRTKVGCYGMGNKRNFMSQQRLSCIREGEGVRHGRRNSVVTIQQSKNEVKYPVLVFRKILFELHPIFLVRVWLASVVPCTLFSQNLI